MSNTSTLPPRRVLAYVDGFNLYFGMKYSGWKQFYWLDICRLVQAVLPPNSILIGVKYFTARVISPESKRRRQNIYLEALTTLADCKIIFGKYQMEQRYCFSCYAEYEDPQEKMTDVNIAVEMMAGAFQSNFDLALLISGDSDLTPPVSAIRRLFPEKGVIVAFPPRRESMDLKAAATSSFIIAKRKFQDSQLPDEVVKPDGYILRRPPKWTKESES